MKLFDKISKGMDKITDHLDNDIGKWGPGYNKFIRTSIVDELFEIPIREKCLSMSYRKHKFPSEFVTNVHRQFGLESFLSKPAELHKSHPVFGLFSIAELFGLKIGLRIKISEDFIFEGGKQVKKVFIDASPIAYKYERYYRGSLDNRIEDPPPPKITLVKNEWRDHISINHEFPTFISVDKTKIYLNSPISIPEPVRASSEASIFDVRLGAIWTDESAFGGWGSE